MNNRTAIINTKELKGLLEKVDKEYTLIAIDKGGNMAIKGIKEFNRRRSAVNIPCKDKVCYTGEKTKRGEIIRILQEEGFTKIKDTYGKDDTYTKGDFTAYVHPTLLEFTKKGCEGRSRIPIWQVVLRLFREYIRKDTKDLDIDVK